MIVVCVHATCARRHLAGARGNLRGRCTFNVRISFKLRPAPAIGDQLYFETVILKLDQRDVI